MKTPLFLLLLFMLPVGALAEGIQIFIDDSRVTQDTYYPGCFWKHCKEKGKKLKKHYLKQEIYSNFVEEGLTFSRATGRQIKDGVNVIIRMGLSGSGRGYAEFAVETLTLGTAPMKMQASFFVNYEIYADGKLVVSEKVEFNEKRNISILSDTQKYKRKAARKISTYVINALGGS